MNAQTIIATIASVLIVILAFVGSVPTYHAAPVFVLPLLWGVYLLRRKLHLLPAHYAMFALAILFHMLGTFGFYQHSPFPWSFDIYVHFYFAFAIAFVLERFFRIYLNGRVWPARVATLMFMMGFGALHEIMEYVTYLLLGEERGMLKPSTSYFFDTQRDLLNNLLGTLTALAIITVAGGLRGGHSARGESFAGADQRGRYDAPTTQAQERAHGDEKTTVTTNEPPGPAQD